MIEIKMNMTKLYCNFKNAGWKGAFKGIVNKVVNFMLIKGCHRKNITVSIGPCISKDNYNVKKDFKNKLLKKDKRNKVFFKKKQNMFFFDLPNFIKSQLKLVQINHIDMINIDTFEKKNNFFSARRSLSLKHDDYGRNISIIVIN